MKISIADINFRSSTQPRASIDQDAVDDYAAAIESGADLPPVIVFREKGKDALLLADGWHRVKAAQKLGRKTIEAKVLAGGKREAMLYACGANASHGLRRTNADKRHAVEIMLGDREWRKWSDREIAKRCAVSHEMVRSVRASLPTVDSDKPQTTRKFVTRHGTEAEMPLPPPDDSDPPPDPAPDPEPGPPPDDEAPALTVKVDSQNEPEADHNAAALAEGRAPFEAIAREIEALDRRIQEMGATPLGYALRVQQIDIDLRNAARAVRFAAPYKLCPNQPNCATGCATCQTQGWVTKDVYDRMPEELKS